MKHLSSSFTRFLLIALLFVGQAAFAQLPSISSVTPSTGLRGTSVTISGSNFNTTAANNIVYFGAAQATVTSASSTSLTVSVPTAGTINRISVTNTASNLTGYAQYPFLPLYDNAKYSGFFNFAAVSVFSSTIAPSGIACGDFDNDGKLDVALCDAGAGKISVYRNKANVGTIVPSSMSKIDSVTGSNPNAVAVADLDGDGKLDMVIVNTNSATFTVYRNTSTAGSGAISFAARQNISVSGSPVAVSIADIDMDGKPDVIINVANAVGIYRNTSTVGAPGFAAVTNFSTIGGSKKVTGITVADIDGDGLQDVITCNDSNTVSILRNTSTSGTLSFDAKVSFPTGTLPKYIVTGDFDGDGKLDIATANTTAKTVSVFRNTATSGSINSASLASAVDFAVPSIPNGITVSDVEANGKLDIIVSNAGKVGIMRNTASSGSITSSSFAAVVNMTGPNTMTCIASGDIDGDGKEDLFGGDYGGNSLVAFRNNPLAKITGPTTTCTGTNITLIDSTVSGTWISTNTAIATVVPGGTTIYTTTLTPVAAGTVVIKYAQPFDTVSYTVTIGKSPTAYTVSGGGTTCAGGSGLTVNLSSSDTGVTYQLKSGTTNIGSPVAGTGAALSFNVTASGTYTIVATGNAGCTSNMTGSAVAVINPTPTVFNVTGGGQYCPASSGLAIGLNGSQTGVNYSLKLGSTTVSTKAGTNSAISFGSAFSTLGTYSVVATNATTGCTANMSGTTSITADFTDPVAVTKNINVYLGATGSVTITPSQVDNGSSDNCSITGRSLDVSTFTAANIGANTVNFTVTDGSGNSASGTATVTVADTTRPSVITKNVTIYLTAAGTASVAAAQVDNGSTDNVGIATKVLSKINFNNADLGANTVTLTVTDNYGNAASATATVTVADTIRPIVNTQNVIVYLDATGNASVTAAQVDNGSTDNISIASISVSPNTFTAANLGTNTVTLTVTDGSGNSATRTATVTVIDNTAPVVHTQNVTVYLDASGNASVTAAQVNNGSTDNGGIASMSVSPNSFTSANLGTNTVTLTVIDGSGNSANGTATVTVVDNIAPVVHTQNVTVYLDATGNASVTAAQVNDGSTDNGGIASMSVSPNSFTSANLGSNTVTLTVTDGSGNSATGTATVTVVDNTAPVVHTQNLTVYLDANGNATITAAQVDNGSTDNGGIASRSLDVSSFTASNLGQNTVTLTVCDASGNCSTGTAIVTIEDNIAPVVHTQNVTVYLDASGNASVTAAQVNDGSTDNGGIASMSVSPNAFTAANLGSNTVTLTVTDGSGNSATGTATVTVVDNIAPVVHTQNITVYLDANGDVSITPADVDNGSTDNGDIATRSLDVNSFTASDLGPNTVTLTVCDASGNCSTGTAVVTIQDNTAPVVHTQNVTVYLDASGNASVTAAQVNDGSTDNGGIASMSVSPNSFTASNLGSNTVTLTVTDGSGNSANGTATVTVVDNIAPVVHTQNVTVYLDATGNASVTAAQVNDGSTDNGGIASMSVSPNSFTAANLGTNTVTLTVTDGSGNSATGTATVTVVDNTAPVVHTQNVTVYLNASGNASVTAAQVNNGSTDNGGIASMSVSPNSFTASNLGSNTVTLTVTDGSGNSATGTATVTVIDNTAPVVHTQNVTVYLDASGNASVTAAQVNDGSTDNGGIASMSVSPNSFTASNLGSNTVTLTVIDGSGNSATGTATVTVVDNIAPVVHTQNVTVYLDASGNASVTAAQVNDGSTDNGGIASMSVSPNSFTASNLGSNTVTLTVTDGSGNSATGTATVTVVDNIAPVVHTQNVTVYLNASGNASVTASQVNDGSTDNGGIASMSVSPNTFTAANLGNNTVTLTVADASGNSASGTAVVTVADTTKPVVVTKSATIYLNASGLATLATSDVNNGSSDNGGIASISLSKTSFSCANLGTNTVVVTVTDNSGNTSSANATVTITDNIAPVVSCPAATTTSSGATTPATTGTATATDNCSASPIITYTDVVSAGTITRTWKATDASGNYSTCSQTITVNSMTLSAAVTQVNCKYDGDGDKDDTSGAISLTVTGGVGRLTYSWSNGKTTKDISGLDTGTYTVTVADSLGSTKTGSWTITAPARMSLSGTVVDASCYGTSTGSVTTIIAGGTAPFSYSWKYSTATTSSLTSVSAGHYKVTVTDAHGCKKEKDFEVHQPYALKLESKVTNVSCNTGSDGAVDLQRVSGGTAGYSYSWSNGATTQDVSGLTAGSYNVTVTDSKGCKAADTFVVTQPTAITVASAITNATCNGSSTGKIDLTVSGGTSGYSYSWSNGKHDQDIKYLAAGSYTVTVTDYKGCTKTASYTVNEPTAISITGTVTNVTCNDDDNGAITLSVSGGAGSYTYSWDDGGTSSSTGCGSHSHHSCSSWWSGWCYSHRSSSTSSHSKDISGIEAGTYTVTVTDANGCSKTATFTVTEPTAITATASVTNVTCNGGNNGAITQSVSGGTGSYTYSWSNGATTKNLTGLAAGTYSVTITDAHGCTKTASYTVSQPAAISLSAVTSDVLCKGSSNGAINLSVSGGTASYSYTWSTSAHTQDVSGLAAGSYNVTVTDANGCTKTASYTVAEPTAITVAGAVTNVACKGSRTGKIDLTVSGGNPGYSYSWSNGKHDQDIKDLAAGTYTVTITDHNGCTKTASYTVTEPATALAASISVSPVYAVPTYGAAYTIYLGYGKQSDSLIASASGGTSGYTYSWSPSSVSSTSTAATKITPTATTTYTVTVTDANGCTVTKTQTITVIDVSCDTRGNNHKVVVCQVNKGKTHDICVDSSSVASHLAAGDRLGSCDDAGARVAGSNEEQPFTVKVFPNPNNGVFSVIVPAVQGNVTFEMIDMTGKIIDTKTIQDASISQQVEFKMTDAVRGLYFLKVIANDKAYMEKIVIQ